MTASSTARTFPPRIAGVPYYDVTDAQYKAVDQTMACIKRSLARNEGSRIDPEMLLEVLERITVLELLPKIDQRAAITVEITHSS